MTPFRVIVLASVAICFMSLFGCGGKETGTDRTAIDSPAREAVVPDQAMHLTPAA